MKTGTDTYIPWKQEYSDQDVIKSRSNNICPTPAEYPLLFSNFSIPPFLGIFGKVSSPLLKKEGARGRELWWWQWWGGEGGGPNYVVLGHVSRGDQSYKNENINIVVYHERLYCPLIIMQHLVYLYQSSITALTFPLKFTPTHL